MGYLLIICTILCLTSEAAISWPLKVNAGNRYLEDQTGAPFFIQGESAWSSGYALTVADQVTYLDSAAANGFTALLVRTATPHYTTFAPTNIFGQIPFTGGAFDAPVEAYWTNLDAYLDRAKSRGILVFLAPLYSANTAANGYRDEMVAQGTNVSRIFGQWIGNRYKAQGNIVWLAYGDCNPDSSEQACMEYIMAGIASTDIGNHLMSAHHMQRSARANYDKPWLDVNTLYHYTDSGYSTELSRRYMEREYNNTTTYPVFFIEGKYEGDGQSTTPTLDSHMRRQSWWGAVEGCLGAFFGNNLICESRSGWESSLTTTSRTTQRHLGSFMAARQWWLLTPDTNHVVVTAGYGSENSTGYSSTSIASDKSFSVTYIPQQTAPTLTVAMTQFTQTMRARWYNPRDGTYTAIGDYPNTGTQQFTPSSSLDWVLAVDQIASAGNRIALKGALSGRATVP